MTKSKFIQDFPKVDWKSVEYPDHLQPVVVQSTNHPQETPALRFDDNVIYLANWLGCHGTGWDRWSCVLRWRPFRAGERLVIEEV